MPPKPAVGKKKLTGGAGTSSGMDSPSAAAGSFDLDSGEALVHASCDLVVLSVEALFLMAVQPYIPFHSIFAVSKCK